MATRKTAKKRTVKTGRVLTVRVVSKPKRKKRTTRKKKSCGLFDLF